MYYLPGIDQKSEHNILYDRPLGIRLIYMGLPTTFTAGYLLKYFNTNVLNPTAVPRKRITYNIRRLYCMRVRESIHIN